MLGYHTLSLFLSCSCCKYLGPLVLVLDLGFLSWYVLRTLVPGFWNLGYPLRALVPWFFVLVLRTRILIHVLDLGLSLVLGPFLVFVLFWFVLQDTPPRIYGTSHALDNPVSKVSCVPSDTVLTRILGLALRYGLLTYAQGFMRKKQDSLKTYIQSFLRSKQCSLILHQGLDLNSFNTYAQGFMHSKQRSLSHEHVLPWEVLGGSWFLARITYSLLVPPWP